MYNVKGELQRTSTMETNLSFALPLLRQESDFAIAEIAGGYSPPNPVFKRF